MDKNITKKISKSLSGKSSQKFLEHAKQSGTVAVIQKTTRTTGGLIGNKICE